jgi:hypothetical protein
MVDHAVPPKAPGEAGQKNTKEKSLGYVTPKKEYRKKKRAASEEAAQILLTTVKG